MTLWWEVSPALCVRIDNIGEPMTKEDRLREAVLVEIDVELDRIESVNDLDFKEHDVIEDLRKYLKGKDLTRVEVYGYAKELAAQSIRLMMDIAR